ncbi:MAG: hypothetical protein ABEJ40_07175 [Haloarculaceae archaeon]
MPSPLDRFLGDSAESVDLDAVEREASENLDALVSPESYGIDDCDVTGVHRVNEGPDGEPVVVPVARFSLGKERESPDYDVVWRLAYEGVRAMYPAVEEVFVRHYDVQFAFGGSGLFDSASCRRVAVSRGIADRVVREAGWRVEDFKAAMLEAHDVDDEVAPVAWGECEDYDTGDGNGAAAAGAAAGF